MRKKIRLSQQAAQEFLEVSKSESLKEDMEILGLRRYNPFFNDGEVDVDAYIEFVTQFNEFINHKRRPFKKMTDRVMKL